MAESNRKQSKINQPEIGIKTILVHLLLLKKMMLFFLNQNNFKNLSYHFEIM